MKFMEDSLDLPLREVLPIIQQRIMEHTTYFGVKALKSPLDFWIYQELIHRLRPDVIVEIGNFCGGGTLALAHLCDLLNHGRVIGVDLDHTRIPEMVRNHPRISLITGDACARFEKVTGGIRSGEKVLIIDDSSHTYENTLGVLRAYSALIQPGGYFIVEDGICHHGLDVGPNPGPFEAIGTFCAEHPEFVIDRSQENFLVTWNPKGFLRRLA
ncbi:MAG TPA: CmcI family methyltransferase [Terriglobia bacterium]|nr:CmcI family methyltransferase [Terriglobia bacterium]